jgi:Arc/MetJ-type ribon-helix-helix transcriptional regulator
MSTQIAIRLPDEQVAYIDSQVAAGRASSRADLIARLVVRERRRLRALDDIETLKAAGLAGNPDLAEVPAATSRRPLEIG